MTKTKTKQGTKAVTVGIQEFVPSDRQVKWLETAMNMEGVPTITEISNRTGIARKTWYHWLKGPEFVTWWGQQWDKHMRSIGWLLDRITYQRAARDFRYMELLYAKYQNFTIKQQHEITGALNISMTDKDIEKTFDKLNVDAKIRNRIKKGKNKVSTKE